MKKLWKKFDSLTSQSYTDMIRNVPGVETWSAGFEVLMDIIALGREQDADFAQEFYQIDDNTEFAHDVGGWLEDYLDELDMRGMYQELEAVCRKMIAMFAWKEEIPSDFYFCISSALRNQGKNQEALDFCEGWYAKESENVSAATALIYAKIAVRDWQGAEQIVKQYIDDDTVCTDDNDIIYTAAAQLYKASGDRKTEKKMNKAMEDYERGVSDYFMGLNDDEIDIDWAEEELPFT